MSDQRSPDLPVILLGAGGHAKVLLALLHACGRRVIGVCDPGLHAGGAVEWRGLRVLGGDEALQSVDPAQAGLVNGVGQLVGDPVRRRLYELVLERGFDFPSLVHPSAWVAPGVRLGKGAQVMAGAVIQPDAAIGENTIINTRASVDHDCSVGAHVHVAPGATLCGTVHVEDGAFIGAGSTVIQGLKVGAGAVIGAGTTLVRDLGPGALAIGAKHRLAADRS